MKKSLLILSFILLSLSGSGTASAREHYARISSAVVETAAKDDADRDQNLNSSAILPSQTARVSGENGGSAPALRSNNSIRRTQVSQKSPFRIIKAGKVIDRQHFFVFQTQLNLFPSGINSISRYIHIICQMLI